MTKFVGQLHKNRHGPNFRINDAGVVQVWSGTWRDVGEVSGSSGHSPVTALNDSIYVGNDQEIAVDLAPNSLLSIIDGGGLTVDYNAFGQGLIENYASGSRRIMVNLNDNSGLVFSGNSLLLGTPGTLGYGISSVVAGGSHTHAIDSTSNSKTLPNRIVHSDSNGDVIFRWLTADKTITDLIETKGVNDLYITPAGGNVFITGDLKFVGDSTIDATGALTISPDGDMTLGGDRIVVNTNMQSASFMGTPGIGMDGWFLGTDGTASVKNLYAGEFRVANFISDAALVRANALYITPSAAVVSQEFSVPATGNTATLHVYDVDGYTGIPVFREGEHVLLENKTPTTYTRIWGIVSGFTVTGSGEQSWSFTTTYPYDHVAGSTIGTGAMALGFGYSGSGYWFARAADASEQYFRPASGVARWRGIGPYDAGAISYDVVQGGLLPYTGVNESGFFARSNRGQFVASDTRSLFQNIPISITRRPSYIVQLGEMYYMAKGVNGGVVDPALSTFAATAAMQPYGLELKGWQANPTMLGPTPEGESAFTERLETITGGQILLVTGWADFPHESLAEIEFHMAGRVYADDMDGEVVNVYAQLMVGETDLSNFWPITERKLLEHVDDAASGTGNGYLFDSVVAADTILSADIDLTGYYGVFIKVDVEIIPAADPPEIMRIDPALQSFAVGSTDILPTDVDTGPGWWLGLVNGNIEWRIGAADGGSRVLYRDGAFGIDNSSLSISGTSKILLAESSASDPAEIYSADNGGLFLSNIQQFEDQQASVTLRARSSRPLADLLVAPQANVWIEAGKVATQEGAETLTQSASIGLTAAIYTDAGETVESSKVEVSAESVDFTTGSFDVSARVRAAGLGLSIDPYDPNENEPSVGRATIDIVWADGNMFLTGVMDE